MCTDKNKPGFENKQYNDNMEDIFSSSAHWLIPPLATIIMAIVASWFLGKALANRPTLGLYRQLFFIALWIVVAFVFVGSLPLEDRTLIFQIMALLLTTLIGLSSTTFVSNAMAGLMLKSTNSFKEGDYIRVGEYFGGVKEKALLHTEIQSEDRDLIHLPNLFIITNPVQVVDQQGTLISAELSLGYDVHRRRVRELLLQAAAKADLVDPFVLILELGDFAVKYRVSGLLEDGSTAISARSSLRGAVLDVLHGDGVEIMTPSVMSQRPQTPDQQMIPARVFPDEANVDNGKAERAMFDKSERAGRISRFVEQLVKLEEEIKKLRSEDETGHMHTIKRYQHQINRLQAIIDAHHADE
ncbi:MAG: mechanosensitive ion channel domain-containing protein [Pseudomonadota bacterium]